LDCSNSLTWRIIGKAEKTRYEYVSNVRRSGSRSTSTYKVAGETMFRSRGTGREGNSYHESRKAAKSCQIIRRTAKIPCHCIACSELRERSLGRKREQDSRRREDGQFCGRSSGTALLTASLPWTLLLSIIVPYSSPALSGRATIAS
jgi:hypothetical protein